MRARTLFSLLNIAAMAAALVAWFVLPQYAGYVLYGFIAWMVAGFVLLGSSWGSRPVGSAVRGAAGPAVADRRPLPSSGATPAPGRVVPRFCIYCAVDLPPAATRCPACQHPVRPL